MNSPIRAFITGLFVAVHLLIANGQKPDASAFHVDSALAWRTTSILYSQYIQLYDELRILEDTAGTLTFDEVKNSDAFAPNYSRDSLNLNSVYWVKTAIVGSADTSGTYLFSVNSHLGLGIGNWNKIDIYIQQPDSSFQHLQTGCGLRPPEKVIRNRLNLFPVSLQKQEAKTIYLRLSAPIKSLPPKVIFLRYVNADALQEISALSPLDTFYTRNVFEPFAFNRVRNSIEFLEDPTNQLTLQEVQASWETSCFYPHPAGAYERTSTYWAKFKIAPTDNYRDLWFNVQNYDLPHVEVYLPDSTGNYTQTPIGFAARLKSKAVPIWLPVFNLDASPVDTTVIFLKMKANTGLLYPKPMSYIDPDILHFNPRDLLYSLPRESWDTGFFLGVFAIQLLMFLVLFFITRDRLILWLTVYLLGSIFYIPFESLRRVEYNIFYIWYDNTKMLEVVSFLGVVLIMIGLLKVTERFLTLPGVFRKSITIYIILFATVCIILPFRLTISLVPNAITASLYQAFRILFATGILLMLIASIWAIIKKRPGAPYFLLAASPFILTHIYAPLSTTGFFRVPFEIHYFDITKWGILGSMVLLAIGIAIRINRLRQQEAEAQRLQELDDFKSKFYTNVTHEFRTPLTVIQGIAQERVQDKEAKTLIQRNSESLLALVNQMLELSGRETSANRLKLIQGDALIFLKYVVESFHSLALQKNINLTFYTEAEHVFMDYDPKGLQTIVSNLVTNAIKYTPQYGKVLIVVKTVRHQQKPHLQLTVQDNGSGITAEHLPHIFERHYRVEPQSEIGSGIGLHLVQELVEAMQGDISVASEPGKGTTFTIRLPITNTAAMTTTVKPDKITVPRPVNDEKPILLIVEDNADVSTYLETILAADYHLLFAKDGKEGIAKALEAVPDIIISDVMMPEMDGFELTQALKTHELTSHIPVILLTAKADLPSRLEGLQYGADAYLNKPFVKEELLIRLHKLIELRNTLQAHYQTLQPQEPAPDLATEQENAFVKRLRTVIEADISNEDFGIQEICQQLGISRTQLHRKLKALTGRSTSRVIRSIRLQHAKILLETTNLNVSQVCQQVGFNELSFFSTAFKEEFGFPPSNLKA